MGDGSRGLNLGDRGEGVGERWETESGRKNRLGRKLTLYGERWEKGWEMGEGGAGNWREYLLFHPLLDH